MNIKKIFPLFFLTCVLFYSSPAYSVSAGGLSLTNKDVQVAQSEDKAAIIYDGKRETMYESFTFNVNPITVWTYAWLIAVPSKPEVELIKDDLFPKLDTSTKRTVYKNNILQKALFFDIEEENFRIDGVFSRPIDITRFEIIDPPHQIEKLEEHLSENSYLIPKEGRSILKEYQEKNWYFIVAEVNALHIQADATESLTIPGAHTLPIKISFETNKIIYPQKLLSIQPDYDSKDITLGYQYGLNSETILGAKDERVDDILSEQSKNAYSQLPLNYSYIKSDLFVFSDHRTIASNYNTTFSSSIHSSDFLFKDFADEEYFHLPSPKMVLTRLTSFTPMSQLDDIEILNAPTNKNVNAYDSLLIQYLKIIGIGTAGFVLFYTFIKRKK